MGENFVPLFTCFTIGVDEQRKAGGNTRKIDGLQSSLNEEVTL